MSPDWWENVTRNNTDYYHAETGLSGSFATPWSNGKDWDWDVKDSYGVSKLRSRESEAITHGRVVVGNQDSKRPVWLIHHRTSVAHKTAPYIMLSVARKVQPFQSALLDANAAHWGQFHPIG